MSRQSLTSIPSDACCSAWKPRATFHVLSSHRWETQTEDFSISTGSIAGAVLKERKSIHMIHGTNGKFFCPHLIHFLSLLRWCREGESLERVVLF